MEEMVEDSVDCYWVTRCFVNQLHNKYRDSLPQLVRDAFLGGGGGGGVRSLSSVPRAALDSTQRSSRVWLLHAPVSLSWSRIHWLP